MPPFSGQMNDLPTFLKIDDEILLLSSRTSGDRRNGRSCPEGTAGRHHGAFGGCGTHIDGNYPSTEVFQRPYPNRATRIGSCAGVTAGYCHSGFAYVHQRSRSGSTDGFAETARRGGDLGGSLFSCHGRPWLRQDHATPQNYAQRHRRALRRDSPVGRRYGSDIPPQVSHPGGNAYASAPRC